MMIEFEQAFPYDTKSIALLVSGCYNLFRISLDYPVVQQCILCGSVVEHVAILLNHGRPHAPMTLIRRS